MNNLKKFIEPLREAPATFSGCPPNLFKENLHGYSAKGCIFVALLVLSVNRLAEL